MDRTWFPARHCVRDDQQGVWPCRDLASGPPPSKKEYGDTRFPAYDDPRVIAIAPSLVVVNFDMPYTVSGVADRHYYGTGLIVDRERGLVVVDRNTVPVAMGSQVPATFLSSRVPALSRMPKPVEPRPSTSRLKGSPRTKIGAAPTSAQATARIGINIAVTATKPEYSVPPTRKLRSFRST